MNSKTINPTNQEVLKLNLNFKTFKYIPRNVEIDLFLNHDVAL